MTPATIPLFKVRMEPGVEARVAATLASGYIGQGSQEAELEERMTALLQAPRPVLMTNSATAALEMAYRLIGIGPGDEVISTPMTCLATNTPLALLGARIVWADIDPVTGLIDPVDVAAKLTRRTRAIVAVDWEGRACDYSTLRALSDSSGVPIVEDAAHAMLTTYRQAPISRLGGHFIIWSFQAIKHFTCGDGGGLLVPPEYLDGDPALDARRFRWYGLDRRSSADFRCSQNVVRFGGKWHMNDIAASIGLGNICNTPATVQRHRANALVLYDALKDLSQRDCSGWSIAPYDPGNAYWVFFLRVPKRDAFLEFAAEHGVMASPVHRRNDQHDAAWPYSSGPLPGVDAYDASVVAIPCGWWLSSGDLDRVQITVRKWAGGTS